MTTPIELIIQGRDNTGSAFASAGSGLAKIGQIAMGILTSQVFTALARQVKDFAVSSITVASDFNETLNKTNAIFEESGGKIADWAKNSALNVGLSSGAAMDAASMFGIFGKSAGLAGDELVKFSEDNVGLAADLASFFNTSVEEATTSMQAAFRGETEPIRKYGVLLDDASMRQEALAMGIISTTKQALTPQQKILAANSLMWKVTTDAQGDFAKTSEGFANSQRIFNAQIENAKIQLGTSFLPMITKVMGFLNTVGIPALQGFIAQVGPKLSAAFEQLPKFFDNAKKGITNFIVPFMPAIRSIIDTFEKMRPTLEMAANLIGTKLVSAGKELSSKVLPFLVSKFNLLANWFAANRPLIERFITTIAIFFTTKLIPAVLGMWNIVKPILSGLLDAILGVAVFVMQLATGDWAGAWVSIGNVVQTNIDTIGNALMAFWDWIAGLMGTSLAQIKATWVSNWNMLTILSQVWNIIKSTLSSNLNAIKTYFTNTWSNIIGSVSSFASNLTTSIGNAIRNAISGASSALSGFISLGGSIISKIIQGLNNAKNSLITYLKNIISDLVGNILGFGGGTGVPREPGERPGYPGASGTPGWLTVPSGYPNDTYPVRLTSGEQFAVIPAGRSLPSAGGRTTNNYYNAHMTIYTGKVDPKKSMRGLT